MKYIDDTNPDDLSVPFACLRTGDAFIRKGERDKAVYFKKYTKSNSGLFHNARRYEGTEMVNFDPDELVIKVIITSITYERVKA